ncbi:MAG TPA: DUF3300 domain-containing protein [Terriglobales bacterium]|nr:DUF3300 domain-containing protein [Terriglobales bacterium]
MQEYALKQIEVAEEHNSGSQIAPSASSETGKQIGRTVTCGDVINKISAALTWALVATLSLIFCGTVSAEMPPDNVEGSWTIYSTNIGNGKSEIKHIQIQQYGNRITGYFEGPNQAGPIQGRMDVHHIMFNTLTRNILTFRGEVYGDQIQGLYVLHGKRGPWQAVRTSGGPAVAPTGVSYTEPVVNPPAPEYEPVSQPMPAPQVASQTFAPQASTAQASAPQQTTASVAQTTSGPVPTPLTPEQLDAMVAPIALYPDALVAQVLAASQNPDQITYADDWLAQNKELTGTALAQDVDQQSWDPSVKALTQFPSVLDNMAHNLSWTSSLGQAFANQQSDVMVAVQVMRAKAQAAGTLQSTSQITVTQPSASTIVIQPANPQVVYVPQYNPTVVYGAPVVVPYYVAPPVPVTGFGLYFGTGITIGASFGGGGWGGGFGWGWHAWNVNWGCCGGGGNTTIIYNHNTYINNRTWNNTNYNGYHPWRPGDPGYRPGTDTHYGPNGAYHPNGYYGPNGAFHHDVPGTGPHDQPNGGNNGNHGLIGGNGGEQHASGYVPTHDQPNGGRNGDHGLIGGNGGVQHTAANEPARSPGDRNGFSNGFNNANDRSRFDGGQNRSRMSGNGAANRAESNRGRNSMGGGRRPQMHEAREHASAPHRSGGGGGGRRR